VYVGVQQSSGPLAEELDLYRAEPPISKSDDPMKWWRERKDRLPMLAKVAAK
jgi:hypothetical protein